MVEDEALIGAHLSRLLEASGYSIAGVADNATEAVHAIPVLSPDLVLMDIRIRGEMDGIEAAAALRALTDVPVVFLTAHADSKTLARAGAVGPYGYITKPMSEASVIATVEIALSRRRYELKTYSALRDLLYQDELTGLPNRRFLLERASASLRLYQFAGIESTLCACDLDHFKEINETHGNQGGDRVLQIFAEVLRKGLRDGDLACRMGGDEFCAVCFDLNPVDTAALLEPIRLEFAARTADCGYPATCSFGVAPRAGVSMDDAVRAAERSLCTSKRLGGDCISLQTLPYAAEHRLRPAEPPGNSRLIKLVPATMSF